MSEEKKAIVRNLGFGGLMYIPPLRVHHQILKELANSFKLGKNTLETGYGSFKVRPRTIGAALGNNASGDLLPQKDRLMFKRIFILYIQMAFLLSTTINKIFPVHLAPIFKMDTITEGNWRAHVLNLIIKGITDYNLKKKKAIDGCLFALMIVYFHLSKNKDKKREERPPEPWIANWTREQLVERMRAEMEEHMGIVKMAETKEKMKEIKKKEKKQKNQKNKKKRKASSLSSSETETTESEVDSTSEFETEEDSEDSTRKQPTRKAKKMESKKRKKIQEDSDSESESNDESEESSPVEKQKTKKKTQRTPQKTQSKKKKVIVEDLSPEQAQSYHGSEIGTEELDEFLREKNEKSAAQGEKEADMRSTEGHYVSFETIPDVNLGSDDPSSQGHTNQSSINKPAESMLSLVEESASEPAEENMMVVRVETQLQTEALAIVPIQVCLPLSQTTTVPEIELTPVIENEPTPVPEIEPTPEKSPSEENNEGTTKSIPEPPQKPKESTPTLPPAPSKINPAPEDAAALMMMARTASYVPKKGQMPSFSLGLTNSSQEEAAMQERAETQDGERAKTPETPKLLEQLGDQVEKIASGGESGGESFEKFKTHARTNENTADMKEKCYIWATRVKTYENGLTNEYDTVCTLKAQYSYILSKIHLASLAAETHIEAEAKQTKTVFNLDILQIFAPVCYSQHWWLWLADTRKRKFYILDPIHTTSPSDKRMALNTFIRRDKDKEIEPPYINISGQKTSYDCAIYIMKWLEIIQPKNIKRLKYEWDNWTQDKVDHFRVEYAFRILFHEMNQDKAEAIRGSNAIRLSKPSSLLLSPYCQIDSNDIDTN
ncbi:uncharacterized protein DS421_19g648630 [Arachis hypogaea]|uniref:Ubiquitin-like protease family profile domain-containing protein n=2 Tax=Arachis TaxID=3817 RepID=A0A6B9V9L4_ARAHY|nr:uncharacterized protein DS421_19g648630 [Arachis hypogaea]